jgi:alpha-beta hydrolase superfamily lysophospholipase
MDELDKKPLAFSSDPDLISSSYRIPVTTTDGIVLNSEVFDAGTNDSSPLLLLIHGICASIETVGIQKFVSKAKERSIRVVVLELEGHGFSSGKKGVCADFDKSLGQVLQFVRIVIPKIRQDTTTVPYFLAGGSFGGVLSIYAANEISTSDSYPVGFSGVAPIAPAVGVHPSVVPSLPIVTCLTLLSWLAPSLQTPFTPLEDPTQYNCPSNSVRNFSGHWPLSTSKMLLDVTSKKVPSDIAQGKLALTQVPNILLVSGHEDVVVPIEAVESFYNAVKSKNKLFMKVSNAGHDLMFQHSSADKIVAAIMDWMETIIEQMVKI